MRITHKIVKAFTLMEMLIVMVLIGIIFSAGAILYIQFNRYLETSLQQNSTENDILLFTGAFKNEIALAANIHSASEEITIQLPNRPPLSYSFNEGNIIRNTAETTDTFWLGVQNLEIMVEPSTQKFISIQASIISGKTEYPFLLVKEPENVDLFNSSIE